MLLSGSDKKFFTSHHGGIIIIPKSTSAFTSRKIPVGEEGEKNYKIVPIKNEQVCEGADVPVAGEKSLSASFIAISTYFSADSFS